VVLCIDTQGHGRCHLRSFQNGCPPIGVIVLQALHPPSGMIPLGSDIAFCGLEQGLTLAQKTAQASIHKWGLCTHVFVAPRGLHSLVDQGVHSVRRQVVAPRQSQCGAQQCISGGGRCFASQLFANGRCTTPPAHGLKRQSLHARPQVFGDLLDRRSHGTAMVNGLRNMGC